MPRTLAEIAIDAGLATRAEVARAGRAAEHRSVPLVVALVRDCGVDELALLAAIRKQLRVPALDPGTARADADALRMLPAELCRRRRALPIQLVSDPGGHRSLQVAMADPTDTAALAELEHVAGCEIDVAVLPLSSVEELVEEGYRAFTTQILNRRRPFGDGLRVTTQRHARTRPPPIPGTGPASGGPSGAGAAPGSGSGDDTALTPLGPGTLPFHSLTDEADLGTRLQALVNVMIARGLITEGEYEQAVIDLMRAGRDETGETGDAGDGGEDD